ncbi:MFS transporter [uncultured Methanoregula sp.]|uniref:MFS transporter n=1 Tax=uncultured Methanoregula sp. TaxID=1005933 RepID=UPI002AAB297D|nr:MFS transporter [uncultured Methanoregula sp.]
MEDTADKPGYEWIVLSVTTIGVLMAVMQSSALLIVLPDIMGSLHMDLFTVMWVLLIYMLITTAMIPMFGRLADMYGRKNLYVLGFAVFTLGSLLCVFATPSNHGYDLIAFRVVQAIGGALMMANATPMVTDAFKAHRLGLGLGINGIAIGAGLALGPVIGGALAPYGWEWIFLYNVPIGIFGTIWAYTRLREPANRYKSSGFDWMGCGTFLVGMTSFLLAISLYAFPMGLSMGIIYALFIIGIAGILAFLWLELKVKTPMLDLHLFRLPDFAIGCTVNTINSLTRGATLFLLIFFLQGAYGQDPLTAGLTLIPMGLTFIVVAPLSGRAADMWGVRLLTIIGLALTSFTMLGFAFIDHSTPFWWLVVLMLISGIGGSLFMSPNSKSVMNAAPPDKRGVASGTRIMLNNVGSMISMAVAMPMVLMGLSNEDITALFLYGGGVSSSALTIFENGLHEAFLIFFVISLVALAISFIRVRPARAPVDRTKILITTDGSDKTGPAIQCGLGMARVMGADVTAMCVIEENDYEDMMDIAIPEAESILYQQSADAVESVVARGRTMGVQVKPLVVSGNPSGEITRASSSYDLIIMGTVGRTGISHLLLGSVAENVVRSANSPVLVVHSSDRVGADGLIVKRILIPADGSENTRPAIAEGLALAKIFGAEVTVLSIADPGGSSHVTAHEDVRQTSFAICRKATEFVIGEGQNLGITVTPLILMGAPSDEIVRESANYDLVIVGTVGRTGLVHIRLGSVAERTVREARCPVLVVRAKEEKTPG